MLTRRRFLTVAGTALVTAALGTLSWKMRAAGLQTQPADPEEPAETGGPHPFTIALLSDTHTRGPSSSTFGAVTGKIVKAVADLKPFKPDAWLCNGDVTDGGRPEEYEAFKQIVGKQAKPGRLLVTTGNHEFYDEDASDEEVLRRFQEAFDQKTPYSDHVLEGIHFVMLADEQWKTAPYNREWAWLSAEQLRWFEQVLAEHREKLTAVFMHQPLQNTVVWSHSGNSFGGTGQAKELRAILQRNPQIRLWFSGHTHQRLEAPGQAVKQGKTTFICLGSTFYQIVKSDDNADGYRKDTSKSQSRVMEIWPDQLVIKARDHVEQRWLDDLQITIPRSLA